MNQFAEWLVEHHGKDDTALGDFARDLRGWPNFPRSGGRGELRTFLENYGAEEWALESFDTAWAEWAKIPTCSSPGCSAKAAGGSSSFCQEHGGRFHHAAGPS